MVTGQLIHGIPTPARQFTETVPEPEQTSVCPKLGKVERALFNVDRRLMQCA
jgi:hypothetical protein